MVVIVQCEFCGSDKEIYPSRDDGRNHFCNQDCQKQWESTLTGEDSRAYNSQKVPCASCGKQLEREACFIERSDKFFCSTECESEWKTGRLAGDGNPNWKPNVEVECPNCSALIEANESRVDRDCNLYCSPDCAIEGRAETISGENHPRWTGGYENYYGPSWLPMRQKVRDRDENTCQRCGDSEEDLRRKPAVHHIQPVRLFDEPDDAHFMENMVQVCDSCHMIVEHLPESEQRAVLA